MKYLGNIALIPNMNLFHGKLGRTKRIWKSKSLISQNYSAQRVISMTKLFDYFRINTLDGDLGITIDVKSQRLYNFFKKYGFDVLQGYDNNRLIQSYFDIPLGGIIFNDSYLLKSLKHVTNPRFAVNEYRAKFTKDLIPYMGYLSDVRIYEGMKVIFNMPLTMPEIKLWHIRTIEYANRLLKEVERIELAYPTKQEVIEN